VTLLTTLTATPTPTPAFCPPRAAAPAMLRRLTAFWAVMDKSERDLLAGMSEDEIETLERLITRLRENVWDAAVADAKAAGRPAPPDPTWMEQRHVASVLSNEA
jgi:hypothetical protein